MTKLKAQVICGTPRCGSSMTIPTAKMADATSLAWVERFSREHSV